MIELIVGAAALYFLSKKKSGSASAGTTTTTKPVDKSGRSDIYLPPNSTTDRTMIVTTGTTHGSGVNTQQSAGSGKRNRPNAV
jgi:hypothetical protein